MKTVIIVRGVPGCGKTTYVVELAENLELQHGVKVEICSADDYFKDANGVYRYDPTKKAQAHQFCMWKFLRALLHNKSGLIVADNTFIHGWEYHNYALAAKLAGWDCEVHEFRVKTIGQINACHKRCSHDVPLDAIARMAVEFEPCHEAKILEMKL